VTILVDQELRDRLERSGWRDWEDEDRLQPRLTAKQLDMLASVGPPGPRSAMKSCMQSGGSAGPAPVTRSRPAAREPGHPV